MRTDIKSLNLKELTAFIEGLGEKSFRAKQIYQWLHVKQVTSFEEMTNISKAFIEKLKEYNEAYEYSMNYIEKLNGLSPLKKLNQGYSFVADAEGKAVTSIEGIQKQDELTIHVTDGEIRAKVIETKGIIRV